MILLNNLLEVRRMWLALLISAICLIGYLQQLYAQSPLAPTNLRIKASGTHPPLAVNDSYSTTKNTTLTVPALGVLANDSDADGDVLTAILVVGPANGNLTLNSDGSFNYTPNLDFTGSDTFSYKANDGRSDSDTAMVTIVITDAQVPERLLELFARKPRRATATWGAQYLEDPTTYIWQPETFMYRDVASGHEVWKLSNTPYDPDLGVHGYSSYYYMDIGVSPWSADGAKVAFTAWDRSSQAFTSQHRRYIWMTANTDGTAMRPTAEAMRRQGGGFFHWCPQRAGVWYEIGSRDFSSSADPNVLYRSFLNPDGVVTSSIALVSIPTWEGASTASIAKLVSSDGRKLIVRRSAHNSSINKLWPVTIAADGPAILDVPDGYGYHRDLALYGAMTDAEVRTFHDSYMTGLGDDFFAMPGSGWAVWWRWKTTGSAPDRGPVYTGDKWIVAISNQSGTFANNEDLEFSVSNSSATYLQGEQDSLSFIVKSNSNPVPGDLISGRISGATATLAAIISKNDFGEIWPENHGGSREGNLNSPFVQTNPWSPEKTTYWSHFVPDRWGRHALFSNVASGLPINRGSYYTTIGPGVWDYQNHRWVAPSHGGGAQHHDWHGFTDWTVSSLSAHESTGGYPAQMLAAQKYDDPHSQIKLNTTYTRYDGGTVYSSLVRPGQSPDGTKASWHSEFLNGKDAVDIFWTVVYYPDPPTNLSASSSAGKLRLGFLPPTYTDRRWIDPVTGKIDEEKGEILYAREIKQYQIWRSAGATSGWQSIGSVSAEYGNDSVTNTLKPRFAGSWAGPSNKISFEDAPVDGVWYYAITSREHSGLESDQLSEILRVAVSGGAVSSSSVVAARGQKDFWREAPPKPVNFVVEKQAVAGHYRLNWSNPPGAMIRYINIYYSTLGQPVADQAYRIASLPVGTSSYLDWLADPDKPAVYAITAVDWYGNESEIVYQATG